MLGMHFIKRFAVVALLLSVASPLAAQQVPASQTQLRLTIVDQTGAGIPAATVTIKGSTGEPVTFMSDDRGIAASPGLTPGTVTVQVEFPGFLPFERPLTLRRGAMNETVTLEIEGFKQEVTVSQASAPEASKTASTTTLTQEEIDALPDDPDELADALAAMAGPGGATFFMNGFSGGRLPNRDQIRSIRFRQNNYASDNHDAGRAQIDIVTRPNTNWGGNANVNFGGDALNARQPQQLVETPSQERTVQFGVRGPIVAGKTSFSFNANGNSRYNSSPIIAIDEFGSRVNDSVRATNDQSGFTLGLEHSLTQNQSLLFNFQRSENEGLNQGVGGFNLPERASTRLSDSNQLRARLQSVIGTKMLNEARVQVNVSGNEAFSASAAPTVIVQDAFTRGGAGVNSNSSTNRVEIADNFDFTIGKHQMRAGLLLEGAFSSNFDERNAAGTWTYRNVDDFIAGRAQQFSQRLGTVDTSFSQYQAGFYWSDEFRIHRDVSVGVGVRNELQSRIGDKLNLMPRVGVTWAPFGSQTSAIRGGYGLFYDWYEAGLYDQTLRVDGITVRDIRISCIEENGYCANVSAVDPLSAGVRMTASGRIQASPDLQMPRVHQASIGYDRQLTPNIMLQTSYQLLRGENQMRSRNINAPIAGVRPNPAFGDITQFESTGRSESDRLTVGTRFRLPLSQTQQPVMFNVNYTFGHDRNSADGATSLPSDSLNPDVDWGPSRQDIRHRVQMQAQVPLVFGVRGNFNVNLSSGVPYNMTTGLDDNDDGVFNDRPAGVTRNSLRGDPTWGLNLNLSRRFALGAVGTPVSRGAAQQGGGGFGGPGGGRGPGGPGNSRYSMELFVQAQNILNHVTHTGYTGNLSSPFFGTATSVGAPRDVNIGLRFNF
jgi:hypothetical protein